MIYQKEIDFLNKCNELENITKSVGNEEIDKLVSEYPNVPIEFVEFLKEIGGGYFNNAQYEIKSFLFKLSDIGLENIYDISDDTVFFGDNHMGDFVGFDLSKKTPLVIELDHVQGEIYETNQTFRSFLHEQIGYKS